MQPLLDTTVVSHEHPIAAPFASRQLADPGARRGSGPALGKPTDALPAELGCEAAAVERLHEAGAV